jgi:2',3'-cyclic-nucleotide 2'-phosphodiesterase (5'-nucleotidase family)
MTVPKVAPGTLLRVIVKTACAGLQPPLRQQECVSMNVLRRTAFVLIAAMAAAISLRAAPVGAEALVLVIGDQHSAYERTAQFVATVDRLKAENPALPLAVLIDGDTLEYGNLLARRSAGEIDFAMFTALARRAPTILNLGNHEPEFYDLAETVQRIQATGVTVVSNIINRATNRPFASASTRLKLGNHEAVVVGVTTDHLSTYRVAVRPTLDLTDPVMWAKQNFPAMLDQAPVKIILSHAGVMADRGMFPVVPDGTLFAGAHDHMNYVHPLGRTVYFHSGSWNQFLSLGWLCRDNSGGLRWEVEQIEIARSTPPDPAIATVITEVRAKYGDPVNSEIAGHSPREMTTAEAGRFIVGALRTKLNLDAVFVGYTTFGAGLPAGDVMRRQFDSCLRFDGAIFTAEVDGARLRQLLAAANQGPDTPFAERHGDYSLAAGPSEIDPTRRYRIATNDWAVRNAALYFGEPALTWQEQPGVKLKALALEALQLAR